MQTKLEGHKFCQNGQQQQFWIFVSNQFSFHYYRLFDITNLYIKFHTRIMEEYRQFSFNTFDLIKSTQVKISMAISFPGEISTIYIYLQTDQILITL